MTITTTLTDADGGTDLVAVHAGLPSGVRTEDNEAGWAQALDRLAALVEAAPPTEPDVAGAGPGR